MKIIPTTYKGVAFRSRTEARWAVFFDTLGIKWEYEPEAFVLSDGRGYTPDFWIVNDVTAEWDGGGAFVEVKPAIGGDDEKASAFAGETEKQIFVVRGAPSEDHGFALPYCNPEVWIPPYPFGNYEFRAFVAACVAARTYRFWDPPRLVRP